MKIRITFSKCVISLVLIVESLWKLELRSQNVLSLGFIFGDRIDTMEEEEQVFIAKQKDDLDSTDCPYTLFFE